MSIPVYLFLHLDLFLLSVMIMSLPIGKYPYLFLYQFLNLFLSSIMSTHRWPKTQLQISFYSSANTKRLSKVIWMTLKFQRKWEKNGSFSFSTKFFECNKFGSTNSLTLNGKTEEEGKTLTNKFVSQKGQRMGKIALFTHKQCDQMLEWKVAQFAQNLPQKLAKVVFN